MSGYYAIETYPSGQLGIVRYICVDRDEAIAVAKLIPLDDVCDSLQVQHWTAFDTHTVVYRRYKPWEQESHEVSQIGT